MMKKTSGKILSLPLAIIALVIIVIVGIYLALVVRQTKQEEELTQTPITSSDQSNSSLPSNTSSSSPSDETANWQTYKNEKYGFEFQYPQDWKFRKATTSEVAYGKIVYLQSSETIKGLENNKIDPGYSYDLTVSYWKDINNEYARGGTVANQKVYQNLNDFLNDQDTMKQKISETTLNGQKAYAVLIGGSGSNYGVMTEKNGIYELSFETAWDLSKMTDEQKQILSAFKFIN